MRIKLTIAAFSFITFGIFLFNAPATSKADICGALQGFQASISINAKTCSLQWDGTYICNNNGSWQCNGSYACNGSGGGGNCTAVGQYPGSCSTNVSATDVCIGDTCYTGCNISADRRTCTRTKSTQVGGCMIPDPTSTPAPTNTPPPGCVPGSCDTSNCSNTCQGSGCGWNGCSTCSSGTKVCSAGSNINGYHDAYSGIQDFGFCHVAGWATDPDNTSQKVNVRVLVDGNPIPVISGQANIFRGDLLSAGVCSGSAGNCAFDLNLNSLVTYNTNHTIVVEAQDINTNVWTPLTLTPRTLYCEAGVIQGFKVIEPGAQAIPPASTQTVSFNRPPVSTSSTSPYGFSTIDLGPGGTRQLSIPAIAGYTTSATICYNSNLSCGSPAVICSAGTCSANVSLDLMKSTFNMLVDPYPHADLWWHYTPIPPPTCSVLLTTPSQFTRDSSTTNSSVSAITSTTNGGVVSSVTLALTSGSGNSITSTNPDTLPPYTWNVATQPTATGPVTVRATCTLQTGQTATAFANVPVVDALNGWWQLKGGGNALAPNGNIRSLPPFGSATDFVCSPGTGTCGIGLGSSISVLPGKWAPATSPTWLVNGSTNTGIFDTTILTSNTYSYTTMLTQAKALFDVGTTNSSTVNLNAIIASQSASSDGVKYVELTSSNNPITITTPSNIGVSKLVVFAPGNVNITADLVNHVGSSYGVLVILANGNISVDPVVRNLDGVYYAQGSFSTGTGTNQLTVTGTVVGISGVNLQRGPVTTAPSEIFNFLPHYIVNFPQGLNRKHTTQRLGEP